MFMCILKSQKFNYFSLKEPQQSFRNVPGTGPELMVPCIGLKREFCQHCFFTYIYTPIKQEVVTTNPSGTSLIHFLAETMHLAALAIFWKCSGRLRARFSVSDWDGSFRLRFSCIHLLPHIIGAHHYADASFCSWDLPHTFLKKGWKTFRNVLFRHFCSKTNPSRTGCPIETGVSG